ncbi:MAG: hypothetical protein ABI839_05935 [Verrucomicrobiota bacterium]
MKMHSRDSWFVVVALLLISHSVLLAETADSSFQRGNARYAAADYPGAAAAYEEAAHAGAWSPNLFYNLGNARFREGDFGRAILNYRRTIALERDHLEANANLRLARARTQALEFKLSPSLHYLGLVSSNAYTVAAAILCWAGLLLLLWRRQGLACFLGGLFITLAIGCALATFLLERAATGEAVILAKDVEARVATTDTARSLLALPPGSEIRILQQRGDWCYAELPDSQRGWIDSKAAELIRL